MFKWEHPGRPPQYTPVQYTVRHQRLLRVEIFVISIPHYSICSIEAINEKESVTNILKQKTTFSRHNLTFTIIDHDSKLLQEKVYVGVVLRFSSFAQHDQHVSSTVQVMLQHLKLQTSQAKVRLPFPSTKNILFSWSVTSDAKNFSLGPAETHSFTPFSLSSESSSFMLLKTKCGWEGISQMKPTEMTTAIWTASVQCFHNRISFRLCSWRVLTFNFLFLSNHWGFSRLGWFIIENVHFVVKAAKFGIDVPQEPLFQKSLFAMSKSQNGGHF